MLSVRKQDPLFINFIPKTAEEAVDRYMRCKKRGLRPFMIPECLIECAKGLNEDEAGKFEAWLINPEGSEPEQKNLVEINTNLQNKKIFDQCAERCEALIAKAKPIDRLMITAANQEDEKEAPEETL